MECFVRWRLGCMLAVVYDERDQVLPDGSMSIFGENAQAEYGDLDFCMNMFPSRFTIKRTKNSGVQKLSDETTNLNLIANTQQSCSWRHCKCSKI